MKILIIGAGGHAKVIVDIIKKENKFEVLGFLDNSLKKGKKILGYEVLGNEEDLNVLMSKHSIFGGIIAIGDNYSRSLLAKKIKKLCKQFKFINCIHPMSSIAFDVSLGEGNVVMAGATINTSSKIGNHCILNTNCSVDHDNKLLDFSSLAPNAVTAGNVKVGEFSAIGISASILQNISIEDNCIIGAGSMVNKNTKSNSVYFGTPAKFVRDHTLGQKYL